MTGSFWTVERVADAIGVAGPRGHSTLAGVSTDTRTIGRGDVFVALRGERFDAHDYLAEAVARGAGALVVSRAPRLGELALPIFIVPDTLVALGALAGYWRAAWSGPVVAVAGSNGKTTTKELIRAVLGSRLEVFATTGNLNNRVGVPLSLLAIPPHAAVAVLEIGTSIPGEVAALREIARPDVGVVTSVAEEHLEGLGDIDGVLREEASVYDGVRLGIAPSAQPEIVREARTRARQVTAAGLDDGDLRAERWSISREGVGEIVVDGIAVRPPLRGLHNLRNAMLALAVARACGVGLEDAARGIATMTVPRMRTAWEQLGGLTLINDAYNSNPGSARAAIEMVKALDGGRQRVIVLGTMRELGPSSAACHDEVARLAVDSGADVVAGVGEFAGALERVPRSGAKVVTGDDVDDIWPRLAAELRADAVILLKASRGVRLERLVPLVEGWSPAVSS